MSCQHRFRFAPLPLGLDISRDVIHWVEQGARLLADLLRLRLQRLVVLLRSQVR